MLNRAKQKSNWVLYVKQLLLSELEALFENSDFKEGYELGYNSYQGLPRQIPQQWYGDIRSNKGARDVCLGVLVGTRVAAGQLKLQEG